MSIVRKNLLNQENYSPYCGNDNCIFRWPRAKFNGEQFACKCGWISSFEEGFIKQYKKRWSIK